MGNNHKPTEAIGEQVFPKEETAMVVASEAAVVVASPTKEANIVARPMTEEELSAHPYSASSPVRIIMNAFQTMGPGGGEVPVGKGVVFGPFSTQARAMNWGTYYLGKATLELQWGKEKNSHNKRLTPTKPWAEQKEDGWYLMVRRIRE